MQVLAGLFHSIQKLVRPLFVVSLAVVPTLCVAQTPPGVGRPILFVHGWCSDASDWGVLRDNLISSVTVSQPELYTDPTNYTVYYDGQSVKLWPTGHEFLAGSVPASARFFSVNLYDILSGQDPAGFFTIDKKRVASVSILNKADELAQVIAAITELTHVKDVLVVAHSMGGLVARAYIENQAVPWAVATCSDTEFPEYQSCAHASKTKYTQDIAKLITLDTPNGGAELANFVSHLPSIGLACFSTDTLNRRELEDTSWVMKALTTNLGDSAPGVTIVSSIKSYTLADLPFGGTFSPADDGIVTAEEQSIHDLAPDVPEYYDVENAFQGTPANCSIESGTWPLHRLNCVGTQFQTVATVYAQLATALDGQATSITVQATLGGNPWTGPFNFSLAGPSGRTGTGPNSYYGVAPGTYTLAYTGGGPTTNYSISPSPAQFMGIDHFDGYNRWNLTFTIAFTSSPTPVPTVVTLPATVLDGGSATLTGTVNPNGAPAAAWFEWGTDPALVSPHTTPVQSAGLGVDPVTINFALSGLESYTPYYYRIAALGTGSSVVRGSILSFVTSTGLPAPLLLTPANDANGVPLPPVFSWSAVWGATSYRLIVATSASALPTDPTSPNCGSGCVLNVTPTGTSYVPAVGALAPQTTYYWQVRARTATQYGNWSAVSSFNTGSGSGSVVAAIAAGYDRSFAVQSDGRVWAWGLNNTGQLGDGSTTNRTVPVQVSGLAGAVTIAGDSSFYYVHNLALKSDGTVWAWGSNTSGQLGDGSTTGRLTPVQVSELMGAAAIAGGFSHSLALKSDGTVWAWGDNNYGQLGDGSATQRKTPVQVSGLTGVVAVAGGDIHSLALKSDGTVWAWGANYSGTLGDGTTTNRTTPVEVSGLTGVVAIAGYYAHSLALKSDGTVWAWGLNEDGQLGDGSTTDRWTPVQVNGLVGVAAIAVGFGHSLAVKRDGTVWAWGRNSNGQLGDGTTTDRWTPAQVSDLTGITAVAGGYYHSLALKSDGSVWAWGRNAWGGLGDGTTTNRLTPVRVSGFAGGAVAAKVGTYGSGQWRLDTDGDGLFNVGVDKSFNWGWADTTPVHGDWNGDGKDEAGFFINGLWYLDYNGNGVWDGEPTDKMYAFGMAGVEPKVGDWNGDGRDEIGIYINGFWFLDMNGNGAWDGEPTDKMIIWGFVGSTPVTGDWNGDGKTKVGLYKDGLWYLDVDGNGIWDGGATDKMIAWGWTGTTPVHGDWNGDGKEEVGVYLNGFWYLDMDGNGIWDGGTTDKMIILGWSGTTPVVGDWNGDGRTKVGTYTNGYWYLDYNGNGVWDGESTDKAYFFGQAGDTPVVGRW
jgi:alpha-tubulin suppressor-like RCC1 family protein